MIENAIKFRLVQVLIMVGPLATLTINPWGNFDPVSVVKFAVLVVCASLLLGLLVPNFRMFFSKVDRPVIVVSALFVFWMLIVVMFSGAPLTQQIWGTFGRNTGFLAYCSLTVLLLVSATIKEQVIYDKISSSLILTSIPLTIYCFVQETGNDPIGWSQFQTFGTLGNINFLSAFLGLSCSASFAFLVSNVVKLQKRLLLIVLLLSQLYIINSTGSIQGLFVFASGFVTTIVILLSTNSRINVRQLSFILLIIIALIPIGQGLINKGPLASYLYQTSTALRADYWHAGYQMMLDKPIFGVGMDSYGDWYRQARGEISTSRGIDRTANTAHNIPLDIGSNGGVILFILYLAFLALALRGIYKHYQLRNGDYSPSFVALTSAWVGYQVQSLVSINQLGVGVWGWLITGSLIGLGNTSQNMDNPRQVLEKLKVGKNRKNSRSLLPAKNLLAAVTTVSISLVLLWFPVRADVEHLGAFKSGNADRIKASTDLLGATAFHIDRVANEAMSRQDYARVNEMALKVIKRYPRDYFAWKSIWISPVTEPILRNEALQVLKELDPFNPEFR